MPINELATTIRSYLEASIRAQWESRDAASRIEEMTGYAGNI